MRVLLADADERFLEVVRAFLWESGHEAETVADSSECLAGLRAFAPDVLVLDHDLTGGGCDGVIARMRRDPDLSAIPVILIADEGRPVRVRAPTSSPVAGIQRRPFLLAELLNRISSLDARLHPRGACANPS
jgi:DNA-binding response OmpR family regulator